MKSRKILATFRQLLDTFIGNFFGIHRQLVAKPSLGLSTLIMGGGNLTAAQYRTDSRGFVVLFSETL